MTRLPKTRDKLTTIRLPKKLLCQIHSQLLVKFLIIYSLEDKKIVESQFLIVVYYFE